VAAVLTPVIASAAQRRLPVHRSSVLALTVLMLCAALLPRKIFSMENGEWRIAWPFMLLLLALSVDSLGRAGRWVVALPIALTIGASSLCIAEWRGADAIVEEFDLVAAELPPGAAVFPVILEGEYRDSTRPLGYMHLPARVVTRSAFSPNVFAYPTQQPLAFKEPWESVRLTDCQVYWGDHPEQPPDWKRISAMYDYVLLIHTRPSSLGTTPPLPVKATPVASEGHFALYRLRGPP
jgi:hypothetical protein